MPCILPLASCSSCSRPNKKNSPSLKDLSASCLALLYSNLPRRHHREQHLRQSHRHIQQPPPVQHKPTCRAPLQLHCTVLPKNVFCSTTCYTRAYYSLTVPDDALKCRSASSLRERVSYYGVQEGQALDEVADQTLYYDVRRHGATQDIHAAEIPSSYSEVDTSDKENVTVETLLVIGQGSSEGLLPRPAGVLIAEEEVAVIGYRLSYSIRPILRCIVGIYFI